MLGAASKAVTRAGALVLQQQPHLWPAAACAFCSLAARPGIGAPRDPTSARRFGASAGSGQQPRQGGSEREAAAQAAAQDLSAAAYDSVKHAAQGDVGAVAEDAMRMAQAGARGAAESARMLLEQMTGMEASTSFDGSSPVRAASSAAEAGLAAADALAQGATAAYRQTLGSMTGTSVPEGGIKGPESTYHQNVRETAGVRGIGTSAIVESGDWAGVMVESAVETNGGGSSGGGAAAAAVGG